MAVIDNLFKFNGGRLALLCRKCGAIVKEGKDFDPIEEKFIFKRSKVARITLNERLKNEAYYCLCNSCKQKLKNK